jgi:hypothetical protein
MKHCIGRRSFPNINPAGGAILAETESGVTETT